MPSAHRFTFPDLPTARPRLSAAWPCLLAAALSGCALRPPPASVPLDPPAAWHAPLPGATPAPQTPALPHGASQARLLDWWKQADDPLLVELIDAAQGASPDIASAQARLIEANSTRIAAGAALGPTVDATAQASRGFTQIVAAVATQRQAQLQTSWEIDVFGANRAARDAAQARLEGARARWHDARVSVAAEVANQMNDLRSCRRQLEVSAADAHSRAETARLTDLSTKAGFESPSNAALARASSAEAAARLAQQRAQCDVGVKALVALTAVDEATLRGKLDAEAARTPPDALFAIDRLPAAVLAQRPDLFDADRKVAAASADVGSAQAKRYPRLTLAGNIGTASISAPGLDASFNAWSIGPLAVSLPLFDGGRRRADIEATRARYDEAVSLYRATARRAVREVEEALVNLQSAAGRSTDARVAVEGYRESFTATEQRYRSGLGSLVELEDARRRMLAAQTTEVTLERERMAAWISLYRAAGGGWPGPDAS